MPNKLALCEKVLLRASLVIADASPAETASMFIRYRALFLIIAVHATKPRCRERMDVINRSAWSSLPVSYLGEDLVAETELVAVGYVCSSTHSVLHTKNNETYLRGKCNHLQLYGNDMTRELVEIRGRRVTDVQFGWQFIAILTADGIIWTAGVNSFQQLGHHGNINRPIFSPVEGLPRVAQIAVGWYHCVALTRDGKLFSWGYNDVYQLGHHTSNSAPAQFSLSDRVVVPKHICCGYKQCAALTEDLVVYTWGYGDYLGRPKGDPLPGIVQGIPTNQNISKLSCGRSHTLVLTESGDLYGWGNNYYGELLGAPTNAPYATKLDLGERIVRDVIAGYYITVFRTYASHGEYFGYHGGNSYKTPQLASSVEYTRDVMSGSMSSPNTWGPVKVECGTD